MYFSSNDFYSDSTLVLDFLRVKLFNVLMLCINSRKWFVLVRVSLERD
jgi:hypothetical protein